MKQAIFESSDKMAVMEQANAFTSLLKKGQFYNTQMNPLLAATKKTKTTYRVTDTDDVVETEEIVNQYTYIILVSYFDVDELEPEKATHWKATGLSG